VASASTIRKVWKCRWGISRPDLGELDGLSVLSYAPDTSPEFVCSDTTEKVAGNKIDIRPDYNTSSIFPFLAVPGPTDLAELHAVEWSTNCPFCQKTFSDDGNQKGRYFRGLENSR
jgi:hypothetical protein